MKWEDDCESWLDKDINEGGCDGAGLGTSLSRRKQEIQAEF